MRDIVGNKAPDPARANSVGNGGAIASRLIPTLAGTQYGTFSYTFTDTGKIKHTYATTQTGVEYDLSDGYTVTAGDVFSTPAAVTDILVDDVSVGLGGTAPNDGKIHTVTFIVNSGAAINYLWQDGASSAFFIGQYLSFKLIDTSTASDITINNFVFDSGSDTEQYARGSLTDKITLINFATTDWYRYTLQKNILHDAGIITEAFVGDNKAINGRFDTDTEWVKEANWTIGAGVATHSVGAGNSIYQIILTIGLPYLLVFDIPRIDAGIIAGYIGVGTPSSNYSTIGTKNFFGICAGNSRLLMFGGATSDSDIDNVSIVHILEVAA